MDRSDADPKLLCRACWLPSRRCICSNLGPLSDPLEFPVEVLLYLNVNEYARKSNTGSLALLAAPAIQSQLVIAGHPDHECLLDSALEAKNGRVAVLYPAPDAIPVAEWASSLQAAQAAEGGGGEAVGGGASIILLDGTWSQARKLNRRFAAEIPRVSLAEPSAGVADGATELRTNTLAALAQALRECWGARRDAGGRGAAGAGSALGGPGEAALQWLARAGTLKAAAVDEIHGGLRGRFGPQQGRDRLAAFREPRRGE